MSTAGLEVFDKTVMTTNVWLDEVMSDIGPDRGPDRGVPWHVLGCVLRALRDRPRQAAEAVFAVLSAHLPRGQCAKVRDALPADIRLLWKLDDGTRPSIEERAAAGRAAQNAQEARRHRARLAKKPGRSEK